MSERKQLTEKFREAVASVLPITLIVTIVCFSFVPVTTDLMLSFLIGSVLLIVGMALFTLGSEVSMTQIGTHMGAKLTKSRKLWLILTVSFLLGVAITVAEPDLQVLAANVPNIDTTVLIITVSVGVGIFLLLSMLRILLVIPLRWMLLVFYALIFILAALVDKDFLAVAFDSGGVTTGPMTVPFIMALGVGVSSIRSDSHAQTDSFGLVALCSIGPILAVMLLGFIYRGSADGTAAMVLSNYQDTVELGHNYISSLPAYLKEVVIALLPIVAFFLVFQVVSLRLRRLPFMRILVGLVWTCVGLVLFLTGLYPGRAPGRAWAALLADPPGHADGLVYHQRRARRPCAQQAGGGAERRRDIGQSHGRQPVHRRILGHGSGHGARADGGFHLVVRGARLCAGAGHGFLCAANVYGHCL